MKAIILGNSGSGKSTLAARLSASGNIAILSLDAIAWNDDVTRRPLDDSKHLLLDFIDTHENWIIEGCYTDLLEMALPFCDQLHFLNPGTQTCLAQARARDWEPDKFPNQEAQDAMLASLLGWIQTYDTRTDEFGLTRHRRLFDGFQGTKHEYTDPASYLIAPNAAKFEFL